MNSRTVCDIYFHNIEAFVPKWDVYIEIKISIKLPKYANIQLFDGHLVYFGSL